MYLTRSRAQAKPPSTASKFSWPLGGSPLKAKMFCMPISFNCSSSKHKVGGTQQECHKHQGYCKQGTPNKNGYTAAQFPDIPCPVHLAADPGACLCKSNASLSPHTPAGCTGTCLLTVGGCYTMHSRHQSHCRRQLSVAQCIPTMFCILPAISKVRSAVVPPAPQVISQKVGSWVAIRSILSNRFSTPCKGRTYWPTPRAIARESDLLYTDG